MDFDLFSCTFENLNNLKFNELQKLSSQYHIKKRWAKKRELIDKLLLLRDQEIEKRNTALDGPDNNVKCPENIEWVDGSKVLSSLEMNEPDESDRRLTYNLSQPNSETLDRRLTFNIVKQEGSKVPFISTHPENSTVFNRRLTYNTNDLNKIQENSNFILETSNSEKAMEQHHNSTDIKAETKIHVKTYHNENEDKSSVATSCLLVERKSNEPNEINNAGNHETHLGKKDIVKIGKSVSQMSKSSQPLHPKVRMLTVPVSRVPGQNRRGTANDIKTNDNSKLKISEKSVIFKKLSIKKTDVNKAPQVIEPAATKPVQKPVTATKMPDFSKIHKKRFEQMDSLYDYQMKKEERAKRLFGISHPGIPAKPNKGDADIFQFKSSINEKENQLAKSQITPKKTFGVTVKDEKQKANRKDILNRTTLKSNIITTMKEENRKHLNGVRTNKRFELQMKCRKL